MVAPSVMQDAAHAADQLLLQHEADKRQWHDEQQQLDAKLQQRNADFAQR